MWAAEDGVRRSKRELQSPADDEHQGGPEGVRMEGEGLHQILTQGGDGGADLLALKKNAEDGGCGCVFTRWRGGWGGVFLTLEEEGKWRS